MGVYEKLLNVQAVLKAPKGQYNSFGKYNYRNCEDILEATKPLLKEHGLTLKLSDEIELIGDRFYVKSTVIVTDIETGEKDSSCGYAREEENKKGMDGSQITGASSSYARKYALNGLFCIDDNKDSDSTNTHGKDGKSSSGGSKTEGKTSVTTISENQIKRLYAIASKAGYDAEKIKSMVQTKYKKEVKELVKVEYDHICNGLEGKVNV
jgi:hypothetical protein